MTVRNIFVEYFIDDPEDIETYLNDIMDFIHGEAQIRKIEFDGYFQERWEQSSESVFGFDESYFNNRDRKNLYVYLSALYDPVIMSYLVDAYEVAELLPLTEEQINEKVEDLKEKGVTF